MKIELRLMQESDLPQVVAIEQEWSYLSKWGMAGFRSVLENPRIYFCLVVEDFDSAKASAHGPWQEDPPPTQDPHQQHESEETLPQPPAKARLAGFAVMSLLLDHCELCDIVVHPHYLAQGAGQALLDRCFEAALCFQLPAIFLEVRQSNHRAIRFYEKNGFVHISQRKNYYLNPREDAWVMKKML
jgi:ribosomal-protein-alanine acetyltransferase